jgi:hypothetical protein
LSRPPCLSPSPYGARQGWQGKFRRFSGLDVKIAEIEFQSREHEILGQMLGTADLIGQMADEHYLRKLHFLYHEFKEGGVPGYIDEVDFLKKTPGFWEMVKKRFVLELGQVDFYLRHHFQARYGIDRDLYRVAIDRNIQRLQFFLQYRGASKPSFLTQNGPKKAASPRTAGRKSPI